MSNWYDDIIGAVHHMSLDQCCGCGNINREGYELEFLPNADGTVHEGYCVECLDAVVLDVIKRLIGGDSVIGDMH
jgi:hypothetical protein